MWANYLYDLNGTELVGFDVGLCTMTPAVNNTGSLYELCNIIHYFNNGTDQVMLNGANNFNNQVRLLQLQRKQCVAHHDASRSVATTDKVVLHPMREHGSCCSSSTAQEEPQPYAVVGGVGAYNGASGTCTIQTDAVSLNAIYVCDFWTPNYASY